MREENVSEEDAKLKLYYFCEVCGKSFANKSGLNAHKLHVHEKYSAEVPCDVCGISFRTRELLKQHQEREHSESPRFACDTCGLRFGSNYHLKRHEVIHTDEEFPCTFCSRRFKRKDGLDTHMTHIHQAQLQQNNGDKEPSESFDQFSVKEDKDAKSITDIISMCPDNNQDVYSDQGQYHITNIDHSSNVQSHVIDPFLPTQTVSKHHDQQNEFLYQSSKVPPPQDHNIMSQIENLSQYKSTTVNSQIAFDIEDSSQYYVDDKTDVTIPCNIVPLVDLNNSSAYKEMGHTVEFQAVVQQPTEIIDNVPRRQSVIRLNQKSY